jgi:uncharacterized protein YfaS (alpha-2-macroglobulin family)
VLGQNRLAPGSQAALRVLVRDSKDGTPLPDSEIQVALRPQDGGRELVLYKGRTDAQGNADVQFEVPEDAAPDQTLLVRTTSSLGSDTLERDIKVERDYRLLVSSDKPIYQPGQIIHLRFLALSTFDLVPARGQEVEVIIADGKGNKVFRKKVTTSIAHAALTSSLLRRSTLEPIRSAPAWAITSSEKTVTVEHYVLPQVRRQDRD